MSNPTVTTAKVTKTFIVETVEEVLMHRTFKVEAESEEAAKAELEDGYAYKFMIKQWEEPISDDFEFESVEERTE